ncbi:hypothetical protein ACFFRR_011765 [Megaselia abdita]
MRSIFLFTLLCSVIIAINGQLFSATPAPSSVFGPVPGGRPTAEEIQRQKEAAASKTSTAATILPQPQPIQPLVLPPLNGHILTDNGYRYKTVKRFRVSRTHY